MSTQRNNLFNAVAAALTPLAVDVEDQQLRQLAELALLLDKWSKKINLTAIRELDGIVKLHLADSLTIAELIHGNTVLDVGTGGGFPGLPLAIIQPKRQFKLLDSSARKLRFVEQAVLELGLNNVTTEHARVPDYAPPAGFDTVTARAFASLTTILEDCGHLVAPGGRIIAMKSRSISNELRELNTIWRLRTQRLVPPEPGLDRVAVIAESATGESK